MLGSERDKCNAQVRSGGRVHVAGKWRSKRGGGELMGYSGSALDERWVTVAQTLSSIPLASHPICHLSTVRTVSISLPPFADPLHRADPPAPLLLFASSSHAHSPFISNCRDLSCPSSPGSAQTFNFLSDPLTTPCSTKLSVLLSPVVL